MNKAPSVKTLQALVSGMDCGSCAKTIEARLKQLPGVTEAEVKFATGRLRVYYDPKLLNETAIAERVTALGYTVDVAEPPQLKTLQALLSGMDCPSCAKTIQTNLMQMTGIADASVNFASSKLIVSYDPGQVEEKLIKARIQELGYTVKAIEESTPVTTSASPAKEKTQKQDLIEWRFWISSRQGQSIIFSGVGLLLGAIAQQLALPIWLARAFYGIGMVVAGYPIARAGWFALLSRQADMNLLMTISAIGAVILGDWFEGALVVFLFALGTTLQSFTFGRTRNAIRKLMNLTPPTATVKRGNQELSVRVEEIEIGEVLTIRPGQRVALDGIVLSGHSAIDQSPITGESIPEDKAPGERVFAGTLNQTGYLEVEVTHRSSDTTVARIIHLVETAQGSRAPTQQWVDRFAAIYTPVVLLVAVGIALIPPLVFAQPFNVWIYRALVMLAIACPCALVISTPVSIVSAIGAATHQGILFKGGNALETAGRMNTLAFDKTGTLTQGKPVVQKVYDLDNIVAKHLLMIAASLEQQSEHPLAQAIVTEALAQGIELQSPHNFNALPGRGIWGQLEEQVYFVGNRRLFAELEISLSEKAETRLASIESLGQTPVLVGTRLGVLGAIALADGVRLEASEALRLLKQVGLKHIVMLTGDRTAVAQQIAKEIGISEYRAELLPFDKLQEIYQLRRSGVVGMVGDGINDAPALAAADVSFAVGGIDIALETADVVLVGGDLRQLPDAVNLSRRTVSVIQQNVVLSLVTKGLFLPLGTFGFVGLAVAVLADMGTSLLVTANGMRLFRTKSY
ncbi:cadmium-translocating P-type ATPase [Scytonema sp. UIC 10036]|uniref:heavy metal translocating P-type ATPase n=1 Tax=Scytonema sp. UIC 10036 TaxID=2304196 RepID=UPI0012DA4304|nr:heavy metal translocating P-type ATPase [Scytonema sp. UIC 10036]MUG93360.1 cadmium-translocating P-type ATPase [Scytonema sp. UIC 10036]